MIYSLADYIGLWHAASQRASSEQSYRRFQAYQADLVGRYLTTEGVEFDGKKLLDLGSGPGGYGDKFAAYGAHVFNIDLNYSQFPKLDRAHRVRGNGLALPFPSNSMDVVFCASLIEHVAWPALLLAEIDRVIVPQGMVYISFPPYYSLRGGHEFSPYHYFGERLALELVKRNSKVPSWARELNGARDAPKSFSMLYDGWGLYKMTIRKFRRLVGGTRLVITRQSTRYLPFSFIRWPVLGEILTWHAQFILTKMQNDDI